MSSNMGASSLGSRFSTLKVFKFGKDRDNKPPPPPPKDDYYLRNRSMASLSPDAVSLPPNSPLSPGHHRMYTSQASHDPNQSTMSLTSSIASGVSSPPADGRTSQARGKEKALSFLKFGKRSPRSPNNGHIERVEPPVPPTPQEDVNISTPFNFQHNIHVDDGLVGLPPTWSTALSQAGFSDEEIISIQNRRAAGSRSPNSQYLLNTRPPSPSIRHPYQTNHSTSSPGHILSQPTPRTTSLSRQYSDASLRNDTTSQRPPIPFAASTSTVSLHSSKAGSVNHFKGTRPCGSQDHSIRQHTPQLSVSYSSDSNHSGEYGGEDGYHQTRIGTFGADRSTPPRKPMHSNNSSVATSFRSQASSPLNGHNRNESAASTASSRLFEPLQPAPRTLDNHPFTSKKLNPDFAQSDASTSISTTQPQIDHAPNRRRTGALPPRLSLHQATGSNDLSLWAGALLSGISGDMEDKLTLNSGLSAPQSAPASAAHQMRGAQQRAMATKEAASRLLASQQQSFGKYQPHSKAEPLSELEEPIDNDAQYAAALSPPWTGQTSSSPLWSEIEGILGQVRSPEPSEDDHGHHRGPYSAALEEQFSPTLPLSPEEERMAMERKIRTERSSEVLARQEELNRLSVNTARPNRDSSRSSTSTISGLAAPTIVRNVSVARRAGAFVITRSNSGDSPIDRSGPVTPITPQVSQPHRPTPIDPSAPHPPSPLNSSFDSEESSASESSSQSQDMYPTPTTADSAASPLRYYLEPSPSPSQQSFTGLPHRKKDYPAVPPPSYDGFDYDEEDGDGTGSEGTNLIIPHAIITAPSPPLNRPTIVISEEVSPVGGLTTALPTGTPGSPFQRYRGWLSEVVKPLEEYIDNSVDPRDHYLDLKEIAEGESGSVFSARLIEKDAHKLRLPPIVKAQDKDSFANGRTVLVAIKSVAIVPSGSPKLKDLQHELGLMKGLRHENAIGLDALYVDFLEDTLWIRMELMERSLADIIGLVDYGLVLQDRVMGRFAGDILSGLDYLQQHHIAHRDVRSDNLLINNHGMLKLTDFANGVQVSPENPMRTEPAGVLYWQAPEVRSPPYNALKVDVWSLGATVWEMAETSPPFSNTNVFTDRWPEVTKPGNFPPAFHDFLRLCSEPAISRPSAGELLKTPFIKNACGRSVIVQLLGRCIKLEEDAAAAEEDPDTDA